MFDNTREVKTHPPAPKKKIDARVRRTRDALGDALIELMQDKPFDSITIQEVLNRAKVGRSTFYSHYSDKADLLMSDAEEFFEKMTMVLSVHGDKSERVFPVTEFFNHVSEMQPLLDALVGSSKFQENFELAQGIFARGIERRFSEIPRGANIPAHERPATAFALAGALLSLLRWWIDRGMKAPAEALDTLFHQIVWGERVLKG